MRQTLLAIVVITSVLIAASCALFNSAYAQSPPNSGSCPAGQIPELNNGKPVINKETHSIKCTTIDTIGSLLGH